MVTNKGSNIHATEESFRNHLKRRIAVMTTLVISGIAILIWLSVAGWSRPNEHAHGFFWGYASAVVIAGTVTLVRIIRCMKNPEKFEKAYIEYTDERNMFVLMKSYYYSAYIFIMLMALAAVIVNFLGLSPVISSTLGGCIGVFALILAVTYRIMKSKY